MKFIKILHSLGKYLQSLTEAIAGYKLQIVRLESKNKRQSAEFKRLIAGLFITCWGKDKPDTDI